MMAADEKISTQFTALTVLGYILSLVLAGAICLGMGSALLFTIDFQVACVILILSFAILQGVFSHVLLVNRTRIDPEAALIRIEFCPLYGRPFRTQTIAFSDIIRITIEANGEGSDYIELRQKSGKSWVLTEGRRKKLNDLARKIAVMLRKQKVRENMWE